MASKVEIGSGGLFIPAEEATPGELRQSIEIANAHRIRQDDAVREYCAEQKRSLAKLEQAVRVPDPIR